MLDADLFDGSDRVRSLVGARTKRGEVVRPQQGLCLGAEGVNVEPMGQTQGAPLPERIAQRVTQDEIAVAFSYGMPSWIATLRNARRLPDGDLGRKMRGQSERPAFRRNVSARREGSELSARVHAGIRAARAANLGHPWIHLLDGTEQFSGDRTRSLLHGPPREGTS